MQALRTRPHRASKPRIGRRARLALATLLLAAAPLAAAQSSPELVEAARKEGSVNVYTSNAAPTIKALVADFEKRYSVKVNLWRASSIKVLQRLVAEKRADRWDFDAASVSGLEIEALYKEGLLQEIRSPLHDGFLEGTLPAHRGWAPQFINVFVQAYNTKLVPKQELPRRWSDFLDAKWKGKLGVEATSGEWYCTLAKHMGEKQAEDLFRNIAARNGLSVHQGNSVLANTVISGELPVALSAYTHIVYDQKDRGAPIDSFVLEPLIGRVNGVGVSRKPPHPNAARLYYEYNLAESQALMVKLHYFSPLKKFPSPLGNAKMVFVDLSMDAESCDATYDKLIRGQDRK